MQSSIAIPRSQPMIVTMGIGLVAAALIGGAGGYALKGLTEVTVATQPARHATATMTFSVPAGIYVQGGRPWSVYDAIRNSSPSKPASTRRVP
jgi:hypothetical protein